jgi:hypothetical protein
LSSPLVFQRAVSIPSKFTRRGSPVGFISFDMLGERKTFDTVIADLTTFFWRIASPVQVGADGGRKFDVKDDSWASEMTSDLRRLLLQAKSLHVCPFQTIGLSDVGINALPGPQALYFCASCATTHARGGRQARGSSERLTTGGWCAQESCHSPGEERKSMGLGSQKSAPSRQIGLVLRLRLVCWSNTPVFGLSQLEI